MPICPICKKEHDGMYGCGKFCGISEWRGNLITLELEHKDGNNKNNDRENLIALCPNCHSQTELGKKDVVKLKVYLMKN